MAEMLKSFEFRQGVGGSKHDWDKWLVPGQIWKLTAEDFGESVKPVFFASQARVQAAKKRLNIQISVDSEAGVVVISTSRMSPSEVAQAEAKESQARAKAKKKR
jgi:hypothetical protein